MNITLKPFVTLLIGGVVAYSTAAYAAPAILEEWDVYYPDSNSSEIACQLCHETAQGGDGWNEYGWSIRAFNVDDGFDIETAFELVEDANSDFDTDGLSNITEIERSMYPGWVNGNTNTIYYKGGEVKLNQASPFFEIDPTKTTESDELCFPIISSKKTVSLVCL